MRIAYGEADLRERAKRLGAIWRPAQKLWEMSWLHARRLGIAERVASDTHSQAAECPYAGLSRHLSIDVCVYL